ncbi:hypothetical protein [Staphylococcus pseudintermedius]|uniref:hypothetical protein n=1 Tax=Staphylococcus pseudintermedius TaxID=283734 RepID=UPI000D731420|nr:hypothetical protein [Staphylococcus pseudintermedius]PWZ42009.1 hypothetical protein DD895_04075 [Staphylococcus pseudintermedius]PWZ63600.1 hypothetical protein DD889_01955 [Staphylococcus pseudintermedius]PXA15642.1 hypothetical protein DD894_03665 [Staphylococcus pseudintermedius]
MTRNSKTALVILSIIALVSEFITGFPLLGGWYVLALGWHPLAFNAFIYLIMVLIFIFNRQNTIRPMLLIPAGGIIASALAVIPFVGMILHWIMFVLMIFLLIVLFVTPVYLKALYTRYTYSERDHKRY